MDESYLKQYVRQQREKRTGAAKVPSATIGSEVRSTQGSTESSGSDSGQNQQQQLSANQVQAGRFARADVQRGLEAQRSVEATRESGSRVASAVKSQGEVVAGAIRILGVKLISAMDENEARLR